MTQDERIRKAILLAKEYPVRITTNGGKFLVPGVMFDRDEYGMRINQRFAYASFDTLAEAVEFGIKWKEAKYDRIPS